jgi:hypothetical protein
MGMRLAHSKSRSREGNLPTDQEEGEGVLGQSALLQRERVWEGKLTAGGGRVALGRHLHLS